MSVSITPLAGETFGNIADNSFNNTNQIHILPLGDINQDGSVTITDLSTLLYGYGSSSTCNCRRWNPYADIDDNGVINIIDMGITFANYNTYT